MIANVSNPEILAAKASAQMVERLLSRPMQPADAWARLIFTPCFGVGVTVVSGLPVANWLGYVWFIGVAAAIWQVNRYLYLRDNPCDEWLSAPVRRVVRLLATIVCATVPCSVGLLWLWYAVSGQAVPWGAIRLATAWTTVLVVLVTHVYETAHLIRRRETDMMAIGRLERRKMEAELEALRHQLDPHFLCNSLHALSWLIENDPGRAVVFNDNLGAVYQYLLRSRNQTLVPLGEELEFLRRYYDLLQLRFEDAIQFSIPDFGAAAEEMLVPPVSLQVLLENAVKHNEFSRMQPLRPVLRLESDAAVMENEIRPRRRAQETSGVGLENLRERCRLILSRELEVTAGPGIFRVRLPLRTRTTIG